MARISREVQALYGLCAVALVEQRADLDGADDVGFDIDLPVFSVGRAAQLADIHPQTLRQYDRQGLIVPQRTEGGARRYSLRDVHKLAVAQQMSQEDGINLAGISRILELQEENRQLRREVKRLERPRGSSIFAADSDGDITEIQRSRQARRWRHEVQTRTRELPGRPYYASDAAGSYASSAQTEGGDAAGADTSQGQSAHKPRHAAKSADGSYADPFVDPRSLVVWGHYFD
ncbi:helix-turn-helix transcriptional regulator [Bifidobacterium sp. ESL0798]|uniref:heat shock protein transcriptional repressor HspR n=1 Tax=unclassified Bifidobacterium TaxID=2608897 RepID=UPI0023F82592|nr:MULTISPECIES: helix-turn-helix transcriptional regulator [unclassified Bifidobacterium]WEV53063.1 helix-turn-helix transcriptional regulator [Bifidobacterium sp. ESL0704]WEV74128.1 helix-turn-helix transcriptional regulator [Bifidobacterium sp. ESL0798]